MITLTPGIKEHEGFVEYLHSGIQIFSHEIGDLPKFRYISSNLILPGLFLNQGITSLPIVKT